MNRSLLDFWVGVFVIAGLLATVFVALRVANLTSVQTDETYRVTANFDNIGGLKVRAPVKSAGVTVGRVVDIAFDPASYQAVVTVALAKDLRFSSDSSMSILTAGLLGEQYIGLETGAEEIMLQDGDSIWLTSSAMVLENLIGEMMLQKVQSVPDPSS